VFDYDRDKEDRGLAIAMMNPTYTRKCPSSDEGPVTHRNPSVEKHEVFFENLTDREINLLYRKTWWWLALPEVSTTRT
jgi:hypothetical protein